MTSRPDDLSQNPELPASSRNESGDEPPEASTKSPRSLTEIASASVEEESDEDTGAQVVARPYDPAKTHIITKPLGVDLLVRRLEFNEIDLQPGFQRRSDLWSEEKMSRLVESLLIRIPIPAFYFDATDDAQWLVVDGLQRLSSLRRFVSEKSLRLTRLEYLNAHEGKTFDELPRDLRRRIEETQVTVHLIQPGTPPEVKYNIFRRINTGGLVLTAQEIRHALNQGPATRLVSELASSAAFREATGHGIGEARMLAHEFVLRYIAFTETHYSEYEAGNLDLFLTSHMRRLNEAPREKLEQLKKSFSNAMTAAHRLFGPDAFRKREDPAAPRQRINKALFEAWAVTLGQLPESEIEILVERRDRVVEESVGLFVHDHEFYDAITSGTGDVRKVRKRFSTIEALVRRILSQSS